jgi:hypothetical protein
LARSLISSPKGCSRHCSKIFEVVCVGSSTAVTEALFSSLQKPKSFQDSSSHRILWQMHETLNIDENKN